MHTYFCKNENQARLLNTTGKAGFLSGVFWAIDELATNPPRDVHKCQVDGKYVTIEAKAHN